MQEISPTLLNEVFVQRQCNYDFRGNNFLERRRVKSVRYDTKSISFLAPKIWKILPNEIKDSDTLKQKYVDTIMTKCNSSTQL